MNRSAMVPAMKKSVRPTEVTARERERGALSEGERKMLIARMAHTSRLVFIWHVTERNAAHLNSLDDVRV